MEEYLLFLCLCRAWATDWLTPRNSHRSSYPGRCFLKWNGVWFWCLDSIPFWGLGTFTGWLDVFWFNRKRHKITCCERVGTIDINNQMMKKALHSTSAYSFCTYKGLYNWVIICCCIIWKSPHCWRSSRVQNCKMLGGTCKACTMHINRIR